jgi:hypothetical protein
MGWWVGFGLDLRIGVVRHWVCDLWHCRRICYLWSWRWLWHSGLTGNRPELEFGYFGWLVVERARGMMENIVGGGESIAWCD